MPYQIPCCVCTPIILDIILRHHRRGKCDVCYITFLGEAETRKKQTKQCKAKYIDLDNRVDNLSFSYRPSVAYEYQVHTIRGRRCWGVRRSINVNGAPLMEEYCCGPYRVQAKATRGTNRMLFCWCMLLFFWKHFSDSFLMPVSDISHEWSDEAVNKAKVIKWLPLPWSYRPMKTTDDFSYLLRIHFMNLTA